MQPPPRKVKVTQELKNIHAEQLTKLQAKHQGECDLLEDLRTFSQKRIAIEKDYAQALQKLTTQYLKRDWIGLKIDEKSEHNRSILAVWKSYLEGTLHLAQSRIIASENYRNHILEPAKIVKSIKEQQLKKCIDQLTKIQAEFQETVKDLAKSKKKYFELEQMAHAAREKADLEAKSKLSLFQSRISLQKASVKLKARRSEYNTKANHARNDYLLTLAAANAHQDRYYQIELVNFMTALDGNFYDHLKEYLMVFNRTELEACQSVQNAFQLLVEASSKVVNSLIHPGLLVGEHPVFARGHTLIHEVLQDYNLQLFLQENPVFQKSQSFQFQPSDNDTSFNAVQLVDIDLSPITTLRMTLTESRQLEHESGTTEEHSLNKEARKWATRVAREHKTIIHGQRTLEDLKAQGTVIAEQGKVELEQKVEDVRETIRKAETVKLKAEARLELLRQIGVAVDTWLKSAMNQVMEELENERWASLPALPNSDAVHLGTLDLEKDDGEELEDNMDVFDDSSSSPSGTLRMYPLTCTVLYSYKANQPDELTIEEHELLEVIEDGDMEDWVKARNKAAQIGYVPEKYLRFPTSNSLIGMLQTLGSLDARSHSSSNSTEPELVTGGINGDSSVSFVKALYDYEGQTADELSFPEGAIIRILNKENQEDDGFWEGELNGRIGVFPSVLVEELAGSENGDSQWIGDAQISPSSRPQPSLSSLPLYDQPPSSPISSPDKAGSHIFPPSPSVTDHENLIPEASTNLQQPRITPENSVGKIRPVRAAPPPPTQHYRRKTEKTEEVEITLV
ncbi:F-BAR and double SH3 domains protein 2-like isoform X2 [Narcine bancroftii]|uniref:F-BAR and double SH3 domains protein 2-like isoform X2 n=1 Tax=Narcine bancroftii TaxID=1343680 RepID=UPI0038315B76